MEHHYLSQLRVFISSTFNDLEEERKYLAEVVFPAFSNIAGQQGVQFCEIDLRWGVPDKAPIIKSCLKEIDFTRPFFIGIIGHSDGTVPKLENFKAEYGVFDEYNTKIENWISKGYSITEMEFQYGAIEQGDPSKARFFWLDYCSHTDKQKAMYKILCEKGFEIVHCSSVTNLGENIMSFLESILPTTKDSDIEFNELYSIRTSQKQIKNQLLQYYVDRKDINFDDIFSFLKSESHFLFVSGENGGGKSTILAKFLEDYHPKDNDPVIIYHFYNGGYVDDIYYHLLLELEKIQGYTYNDFAQKEGYIDDVSMREKFDRYLLPLSISDRKLLFVIDGLEHADYDAVEEFKSILTPFGNCKLIITTNDNKGNSCDAQICVKYPKDLTEVIIASYYNNYRRVFPHDIFKEFIKSSRTWNFHSLLSFLHEIRVFGLHDSLEYEVNELANCTDEQMYCRIISHWKTLISPIKNNNVLEVLSLSHYGLTENTIKQVCNLNQYEWSLIHAIIEPYIKIIGNRVVVVNDKFRSAIKNGINLEKSQEKIRDKIIAHFKDHKDIAEKFDEYPYQLAKAKQVENLLDYLINLDVFHYSYNYRYLDLLKYWGGLDDDDEMEYFDFYVFLEGAGLNTFYRFFECPPPITKEITKAEILKEIMDFIQFTLKPLAYYKFEFNQLNINFAKKILQEIRHEKKLTNIQKADLLLSCSMALGDSAEPTKDYLLQVIKLLEPELNNLLKFHETNTKLKEIEAEWNSDISINYPYNLLNIRERLLDVFAKWASAKNEILNYLSKKKKVEACYSSVITTMEKISDILQEHEKTNILTVLEYSYGMWLHNHEDYSNAQQHLHKSFVLRLKGINDSVSDHMRYRLYENYKLINSCQCRTNSYNPENEIIYADAIERFSPSYLPKSVIGKCVLNCAAAYYNATLSQTIENDLKTEYLITAIEYYERSLDYLDGEYDLEDALKAHFFICVSKSSLDEDYDSNWNFILNNISKIQKPNPMTQQILQIINDEIE